MSQYDCAAAEKRWEQMWKDREIYRFDPESDKPVFSIDNPPRYTSGSLHLGHATGYSLIDFAARYKRMKGFNVFFPLCFDVNGTPIEVKVEKKHGINKLDTPRAEYRKYCEEYAESFIAQMTHHFEILGESMDPSIYYQTNAPYYRRVTQLTLVDLFKRGFLYKANFPVNWCPSCMTALADAEVEYRDNVNKLNYIVFKVKDSDEQMIIATSRPELLSTCQCVAVHPDDKAKAHLIGKTLITPLYNKEVPVISDPKVKIDYGTGNVMICTIGDKDDLEWCMKYHFPMQKAIDEMGRMTSLTGRYDGMKVLEAREAIIQDLKDAGLLINQEDNPQQLSICWRCHNPVEYLQVPQWFLKTLDFRDRILSRADEIDWHPEFMKNRLVDWTNSLAWDWVISRQRIFATPIPIWECEKCGHAVCATEEMCYCDPVYDKPPVDACPECGGKLVGCTDVCDTWVDSSISALYNTFYGRDEELHRKLFPMSLRPQSHDIIRTWAFYSILRSEQLEQSIPWKDIMIHGFIMAPDGTPMHSSIGNVIDPIPILEEYGADALRYYAATCSLGIDHAFREKDVIRGKKLVIKTYNLGQFAKRYVTGKPAPVTDGLHVSDKWILTMFSRAVEYAESYLDQYLFDKAMRVIEGFIWHELADHYVEMVKGRTDDAVRYTLYTVLLGALKMLAIFMPHVTEEVYQDVFREFEGAESIHLTEWPVPVMDDETAVTEGEMLKEVIASVRSWKADRKIPLNASIKLMEIIGPTAAKLEPAREDIVGTLKVDDLRLLADAELTRTVVGIKPVHAKLGPLFKAKAKAVVAALSAMDVADAAKQLDEHGKIVLDVEGEQTELQADLIAVETELMLDGRAVETLQVNDLLIAIEL